MPLGQSFLLTPISINLVRRVTFTTCRCLGHKPRESVEIADDVAISTASVVATAAAIVTCDVLGSALSAGYIALESKEAELRAQEAGLARR